MRLRGGGVQSLTLRSTLPICSASLLNNPAPAAPGSAAKMTSGELAAALTGGCKNLAGKLKGLEAERAALLQSVDMHRSENRRLLEVRLSPSPPLPPCAAFPSLLQLNHSLPLTAACTQESNLLKDTLREAQGGDVGAIARAMARLSKPLQPANKEPRWGGGGGMQIELVHRS